MYMDCQLRHIFNHVCEDASAACASFHTWKTLNVARGNKKSLSAINNYLYVDFFRLSLGGNFQLTFLFLGRLFDKRRDSVSLWELKRILKSIGLSILENKIVDFESDNEKLIQSIMYIRNKQIAHNYIKPEVFESVFEEAGITPDQIEGIIDSVCDIVNEICREFNHTSISSGDRFEKAVSKLLETIRKTHSI